MYGDADPDSYRQSLVAGYLTQLPTIDNSAAEEIVHHHHSTTSNQILELPMLNATLSNSQTTTLNPAGTELLYYDIFPDWKIPTGKYKIQQGLG